MKRPQIRRRTSAELDKARHAARLAADVLRWIGPHVKPGVTTAELDRLCHAYIVDELKVKPANLGYSGFPATICASPNQVVCHGIPNDKPLAEGDILNIDVAVNANGWFGDTARMYFVGKPSEQARRLVLGTYEAMWAGIRQVRPGATLGDVGHAIESVARREGFRVVRDYCGHGIGDVYHDTPEVLHYGHPGQGLRLEPGMLFTIEPMLNAGRAETRELADGWTVVSADGSLSAQWEHMVAVTERGFEVLSLWPAGSAAQALDDLPVDRAGN